MSLQAAALYALVSVTGADRSVSDLKRVSGQVNATQGVMAGLGRNAKQIGTGMGQVAGGLVRIGTYAALAATGAAAAAGKTAMTFQQQMELIHTQAGAAQSEVDAQSAAVQAMVKEVGVGPIELAKGLYHIESAGARGAAALDILRASAQGAKLGLADMESMSNGLVAVWYSGIKAAKDMSSNVGILDGIVGVGNMRMQDLVDSFSTGILGTSKTFGVSLASMGAALATLSDAGVPPQVAATRLSMTFTHMAAPIKAAQKILKKFGMDQFDMARDLRKPDGISVALMDLGTHLQKIGEMSKSGVLTPQGTADVAKLFGGSRFGATAMQLLANVMQQGDRVKQKYDLIIIQQSTFGEKLKKTMETAGFTFAQLKANIEESALAFGDGFLPAIGRVGGKLNTILVSHLDDFRKLGKDVGEAIDNIDWSKVERGASTVVTLVRTLVDLISKVPPEITASVVGFEALNRVSGGLLGKGLGNIAGGLAGIPVTLLRGALSKMPGVGQALVAATALHVWVDNMPLGGIGGGGGLPGALPGVAAAAGGAGALAVAGGLAVTAGITVAAALILDKAINDKGGYSKVTKDLKGVSLGTNIITYDPSFSGIQRLGGKGGGMTIVGTKSPVPIPGQTYPAFTGAGKAADDLAEHANALARSFDALRRATHTYLDGLIKRHGAAFLRAGDKGGVKTRDQAATNLVKLFETSSAPSLLSMQTNLANIAQLAAKHPTDTVLHVDMLTLQRLVSTTTAAINHVSFRPGKAADDLERAASLAGVNSLRAAEAAGRAAGDTRSEQAGIRAAIANAASGAINIIINVPAVQPYVQTIHRALRYGPLIPNQGRVGGP